MAAVAATATKTGGPGPLPAGVVPLASEAFDACVPCRAGPADEAAGDGVIVGNSLPTLPGACCGGWAGTAPTAKGGPGLIGAVAPSAPALVPGDRRP
jgi:hypothetical protein